MQAVYVWNFLLILFVCIYKFIIYESVIKVKKTTEINSKNYYKRIVNF